MIGFCFNAYSFSYQSTVPTHSSLSKGILRCIWNNGTPYFLFTMDGNRDEVYVANSYKIESSVNKDMDYIYLFHSRTGRKTGTGYRGDYTSEFVGKMKVSSSFIVDPNLCKVLETKFVLLGADKDHSRPGLTYMKNSKVTEIFRRSLSFMNKSNSKDGEPGSFIHNFLRKTYSNRLRDFKESEIVNLENDWPPNRELAAIIVKEYQHDINVEAATGGREPKFFPEFTIELSDTPLGPSFSSQTGVRTQKGSQGSSARSVNVVLPTGLHGGPAAGTGSPSSLTERWRSGGSCDCGGWDIGCTVRVLNNNSVVSEGFPQKDHHKGSKSVDLFVEDIKYDGPTLEMTSTSESTYVMHFQPTLSALQSFSIGVAIIHSQIPSLRVKLLTKNLS